MSEMVILTSSSWGVLAQGSPSNGGSFLGGLVPMFLILGIFYVIFILPMRRKQRKLQEMIHNLKRGDKVITNGGIFGTVMGISDRIVQLRIADSTTIEVSRNAVAAMQEPEGGANT